MKLCYEGVRTTDKYLTVYVKVESGSAIQFKSTRVPLEDLMTDEFADALDTRIRRHLIQTWSEVDLADPLF